MNIKYDIQKMKSIISDFANITGLSISLLDTDFKTIITYAYNTPEFCQKIQNCECGMQLCYHSDMDMLRECKRTRRFVSHVCHAGIIDSVMPIFKDMVISGYIMLGRIRPSEDIGDIYENVAWMNESKETLRESYLKIAYLNPSQLESVSHLVSNSLFANAINIEFDKPLQVTLDYIAQNLNGDLSVTNLCRISHTSKNMMYRIFRETFGCTIDEYITSERINKAKLLLETTEKTVQEIGEAVGAENPAHFCRMFKKNTGISPSSFRKEVRGEIPE